MGTQLVSGDETPDVDELQPREGTDPAVPVSVVGPVRVQPMPTRSGAVREQLVTSASADRVLHYDLTRARAVLQVVGANDVFVAFTAAEASVGRGRLPAGAQLEITNIGEVWVRAASADATVTVWSEHWTA